MTEPAMKRTIRERVAALNADITAMTAVRDHYLGVARDMENPMMPSIERAAAPPPAKTRKKRGPNTGRPQDYKVNREALNIVAAAGLAGITAPALAKAMSVLVGTASHHLTSLKYTGHASHRKPRYFYRTPHMDTGEHASDMTAHKSQPGAYNGLAS
jgi:hypothetical protein